MGPIESVEARYPHIKVGFPECGPGWHGLVARTIEKLAAHIPEGQECHVNLKEKFGILDLYCIPHFHGFDEILEAAEDESRCTCDKCGRPGELKQRRGWMMTRCADCE